MINSTTLTTHAIDRARPHARVSAMRFGTHLPTIGSWPNGSFAPAFATASVTELVGCAPTGLPIDGTTGYNNGSANPAVTALPQTVKRPTWHLGSRST